MTTSIHPREELRLRRKRSLANQQVVARSLGISQALYSQIEQGYTNPSPVVAARLIEMFHLPPDYFGEQKKEEA